MIKLHLPVQLHRQYQCQNSNIYFLSDIKLPQKSKLFGIYSACIVPWKFLASRSFSGSLIVIGKYIFKLKIGRSFLFAFVRQYLNNWNYKMHILLYSILMVDWAWEYCGDSGKNNNSFTSSDCFDCWNVLQRILESSQAVQGVSRIYALHRISSSLVKCLNHR